MVSDKQKVGLSISLCFCAFGVAFLCLVSAGNYSTARHPPFEPNAREGTFLLAADANANTSCSPVCHKDIPWTAHISDVFAPKTEDGQLSLRSCPAKGEPVKLQIISYQPETYRNNGNITLHTVVS